MNHHITQINKNATAMLGLPSADIIGVTYKNALEKDLVKIIDNIKKRTLKDGFAFESLFEYAPVKNLQIPLAISSSQLLEEQKKVKKKGASMRLGAYPCLLKRGTNAFKAYKKVRETSRAVLITTITTGNDLEIKQLLNFLE